MPEEPTDLDRSPFSAHRAFPLLLFAVLLWPSTVFAHALLVGTDPPAGATLTFSPRQIRLEFSEQIEAEFNGIALYNSAGIRVDSGRASVDPQNVRVLVVPVNNLSKDIYTVSWHAISADGHPIEGVFGFGVGVSGAALQSSLPTNHGTWNGLVVAAAASQWVTIVGLLLMAGLPLFHWLVWRPAVGHLLPPGEANGADCDQLVQQWMLRASLAGAMLAGLASLLGLAIQTARVTGESAAAFSPTLLWHLATRTRYGEVALVRIAGITVFGAILKFSGKMNQTGRAKGSRWLAGTISVLLLFTPGLAGHPGAAPPGTAAYLIATDWLHLLAAAPWLAGLWGFASLLRRLRLSIKLSMQAKLATALVSRFPRLAIFSVSLLVLSGVAAALKHIPSWDGLLHTAYGQTVLVKIGLLVPVLIIAGSHHLSFNARVQRLIQSDEDDEASISLLLRRFRLMIGLEITLVMAIVAAAGLLVNLPPAEVALTARRGPLEQMTEAEGYRFTLRVLPNRVGNNTAEIALVPKDNPVLMSSPQIRVIVSILDMNMARQELPARPVAAGGYQVDKIMLGMSGNWEADVAAAFADGREIQASFRFYVPPPE